MWQHAHASAWRPDSKDEIVRHAIQRVFNRDILTALRLNAVSSSHDKRCKRRCRRGMLMEQPLLVMGPPNLPVSCSGVMKRHGEHITL